MHRTECTLHHSLLTRARSRWRQFHVLWRHYPDSRGNIPKSDGSLAIPRTLQIHYTTQEMQTRGHMNYKKTRKLHALLRYKLYVPLFEAPVFDFAELHMPLEWDL